MGAVSYHLPDMVASPLLFWYFISPASPPRMAFSSLSLSQALAVLDVLA